MTGKPRLSKTFRVASQLWLLGTRRVVQKRVSLRISIALARPEINMMETPGAKTELL